MNVYVQMMNVPTYSMRACVEKVDDDDDDDGAALAAAPVCSLLLPERVMLIARMADSGAAPPFLPGPRGRDGLLMESMLDAGAELNKLEGGDG